MLKVAFCQKAQCGSKKNLPNHYPKQKFENVAYCYGREIKIFSRIVIWNIVLCRIELSDKKLPLPKHKKGFPLKMLQIWKNVHKNKNTTQCGLHSKLDLNMNFAWVGRKLKSEIMLAMIFKLQM